MRQATMKIPVNIYIVTQKCKVKMNILGQEHLKEACQNNLR